MRASTETPTPLTPAVLHILISLAEGERHGYAIMQDVSAQTGGTMRMGPGTLYGTIKRLLVAGLISESEERPDTDRADVRRRYYQLTPEGLSVLKAEVQRLEQTLRLPAARNLLSAPLGGNS